MKRKHFSTSAVALAVILVLGMTMAPAAMAQETTSGDDDVLELIERMQDRLDTIEDRLADLEAQINSDTNADTSADTSSDVAAAETSTHDSVQTQERYTDKKKMKKQKKVKKQPRAELEVCKILVDEGFNVTDGSELDGSAAFSVDHDAGTSDWETPLNYDTDLLADVEGVDAECEQFSDLEPGTYEYSEEVIDESGLVQNDTLSQNVSVIGYNDDFQAGQDDLDDFDEWTEDDRSDGEIEVEAGEDNRLVVLNAFERVLSVEEKPKKKKGFNKKKGYQTDYTPMKKYPKKQKKVKKQPRAELEVCKVLINEEGNVTSGDELEGTAEFSVDHDGQTTEWSTPLSYNEDILADVEGNDAACVSFSDLDTGDYEYSEEVIDESGLVNNDTLSQNVSVVGYNDDFQAGEDTLDDFFEYTDSDLSDGQIQLSADGENRLVILNAFERVLAEERKVKKDMKKGYKKGYWKKPADGVMGDETPTKKQKDQVLAEEVAPANSDCIQEANENAIQEADGDADGVDAEAILDQLENINQNQDCDVTADGANAEALAEQLANGNIEQSANAEADGDDSTASAEQEANMNQGQDADVEADGEDADASANQEENANIGQDADVNAEDGADASSDQEANMNQGQDADVEAGEDSDASSDQEANGNIEQDTEVNAEGEDTDASAEQTANMNQEQTSEANAENGGDVTVNQESNANIEQNANVNAAGGTTAAGAASAASATDGSEDTASDEADVTAMSMHPDGVDLDAWKQSMDARNPHNAIEDAYVEEAPEPGDPYFEAQADDGSWISYLNPRDEYRSPYLGEGSGKFCTVLLNEDGEPIVGETIPDTSVTIPTGDSLSWHSEAGPITVDYPLTEHYQRPLESDQFGTSPDLPQGDGYMDSHCFEWHGLPEDAKVEYGQASVEGEFSHWVDVVGYYDQTSTWESDVDPLQLAEPYGTSASSDGEVQMAPGESHFEILVVMQLDPPEDAYPDNPGDGDGSGDGDGDGDTDPEPETYAVDVFVEDEDGNAIDDATVTVDGEAGSSHELEEGTYTFAADADGYEAASGDLMIDGDTDVVITLSEEQDADPEPETHTLDVTVENEAGEQLDDATVTVDGQTGTTHDLEPGTYTVEADADGYTAAAEDVTLDGDHEMTMVLSAEQTAPDRDADVTVRVGDGYYQQEDSDLPRDELQAEVGDEILFYNDGGMSHTITIDEYDIDEVLAPGESAVVTIDEPTEDEYVNCRFHANHDATLTVEGDEPENTCDEDIAEAEDFADEQDACTDEFAEMACPYSDATYGASNGCVISALEERGWERVSSDGSGDPNDPGDDNASDGDQDQPDDGNSSDDFMDDGFNDAFGDGFIDDDFEHPGNVPDHVDLPDHVGNMPDNPATNPDNPGNSPGDDQDDPDDGTSDDDEADAGVCMIGVDSPCNADQWEDGDSDDESGSAPGNDSSGDGDSDSDETVAGDETGDDSVDVDQDTTVNEEQRVDEDAEMDSDFAADQSSDVSHDQDTDVAADDNPAAAATAANPAAQIDPATANHADQAEDARYRNPLVDGDAANQDAAADVDQHTFVETAAGGEANTEQNASTNVEQEINASGDPNGSISQDAGVDVDQTADITAIGYTVNTVQEAFIDILQSADTDGTVDASEYLEQDAFLTVDQHTEVEATEDGVATDQDTDVGIDQSATPDNESYQVTDVDTNQTTDVDEESGTVDVLDRVYVTLSQIAG